jgi:hypothetical protein
VASERQEAVLKSVICAEGARRRQPDVQRLVESRNNLRRVEDALRNPSGRTFSAGKVGLRQVPDVAHLTTFSAPLRGRNNFQNGLCHSSFITKT